MILNRLSFNFKLFKEEYKKYIWALALTILAFLFSKIVLPLLEYSNYLYYENTVMQIDNNHIQEDLLELLNNYLTIDYGLNKFIVMGLAIIMGIVIFSYLHNKKKIDFYHSLPISRTKLFFIKYFLGIVIVVPIMTIAHFILYGIFSILLGSSLVVPFIEILQTVLVDILFFIVIYSITVFTTILCGNTIISIILSGILLNLHAIITALFILLTKGFFRPLINVDYLFDYIKIYNPLMAYFIVRNNKIVSMSNRAIINFSNLNIIIMYTIIAIIIILLALILFKIRKSENATSCIAFKYAKTILKYLGVCIGAILVGVVFRAISRSDVLLYIGVLIGCIVLHCIVEIIYDFDFRAIFKNWYSIIGCLIISSIILATYQFDVFKRVDYVPSIEKIENVDIRFNGGSFLTIRAVQNIDNPEVISAVTELHKIDNEAKKQQENYAEETLRVEYKLKNGSIVSRNINILYSTLGEEKIIQQVDLIKQIFNNEEYIKKSSPILYLDNLQYNTINIAISTNKERYKDFTNIQNIKIDKKKLIEAIRKDAEKNGLYSSSEDTLFYIGIDWRSWEYGFDFSSSGFYITDKYTNTLDYLASLNIYPENYKLEDVEFIRIEQLNLDIEDKGDIEKILLDYKLEGLFGFEKYKKPISILLVDKQGEQNRICISEELYQELETKYNSTKKLK